MTMLRVAGLTARYGPVEALHEADLEVASGEIVALVGPNGAGKTTLLHTIVGLLATEAGTATFNGAPITGRATEDIARAGLVLVPEHRRIFGSLTVEENLQVGTVARRDRATAPADLAAMLELFPVLADRRGQLAGFLSGGEAQQLALARAVMGAPQMLLLDEPSLGLAPKVVDDVFALISTLRDRGLTILLVEQNAYRAVDIADRVYTVTSGRVTPADGVLDAAALLSSYLGS